MEEIQYFDEHIRLTVISLCYFLFIILFISYLGFNFGVLVMILIFYVIIYALKECYT